MKFIILNKGGDSTIAVAPERIVTEFKELKEKGYRAVTSVGKEVKETSEIPDTVEELIWGKEMKFSGIRGE